MIAIGLLFVRVCVMHYIYEYAFCVCVHVCVFLCDLCACVRVSLFLVCFWCVDVCQV